jgi:SAM-dependent methyltransferase
MGVNATVARMVRRLDSIVEPAPPRPAATEEHAAHPMRAVTRQIAFEPGGWTAERRGKVAELFDGLAPGWHSHLHDPQRSAPLEDAYARGDIPRGGRCLEVGSGDGQNTAYLASHHDVVLAADLSIEMLVRAPADVGARVRADAGSMPLRAGTVDTAVLVNAFLFPHELDRLLAADGTLVWVNTAGDLTPIHLTTDDVVRALPGTWDGVESAAGWGTWAVLHRATG